jgi:hypothetical protein
VQIEKGIFKMNSQSTSSIIIVILALCAILAGGFALVGGLGTQKNKNIAVGTQAKEQSIQPATDCYESRLTFTAVNRTENVVSQYAYPNIKCSKATGAVLWYGDPFDETIPMGEMPDVKDETRGDFANAVVKPREPHLTYFNMGPNGCITCHDGKTVAVPNNRKPRLITMHQDIVEDSLDLKHGRGAIWCLDCHSATNRNKLIDRQGNEISFNQPQKLCGSCHGEVYIDWRAGIHGKRIGTWATGGKKRWWVCTECHNPHTVQINRFDPIKPESPPPLPKGMESASYERVEHDVH